MGQKPVKYCVVDAFTGSGLKGNPAAACLLEEERDDEWLQAVASEFNLPVTCYLTRNTHPESWVHHSDSPSINPRFRLRWFSPTVERKELLSISKALNVASVIDFKKSWGAQDHIVCFLDS
ncbi:putative isomerase BH0283 [Camellia lanceoleosa]|uniref:Isomerase BH0283 n=1 Tax=Camellia lanceoleosa TaxID=1840588 RepID=A0ACC0F5H1_9ERIC|nr:putative isomerase BH0283 [Camellia lanceoleosa]